MSNPIRIAVDAMGGENSPYKVIKGIDIHYSNSKDVHYNIFGNKELILPYLNKTKLKDENFSLFHTDKLYQDLNFQP